MSENNLLFEETEKECQSKKRKINEYFNLPTILFIPFIACKKNPTTGNRANFPVLKVSNAGIH